METLYWLGIFLVLALLATVPVHFHLAALRKATPSEKGAGTARSGKTRACPQCEQPTPVEAAFCESCGVPMMLWKLKSARVVTPDSGSRKLPIIDQDVCIGCRSCVDACAENVLEIVAGKSAVINLGACTSAGTCAAVCPTGACQLGGSGAARRVEVPQINESFETEQPGIYAVGELGGLGLIKNAIAEGQLVIDCIKRGHEPVEGILDLVIVGAGPAGLSAGLAAKETGLDAVIFEQGTLANTIRRFPNRKIVMAEPVRIPLYGSLWISDAPKETLLNVWETIVRSAGIDVREQEAVSGVRRTERGTFIVETSRSQAECLKVILAIGKRGSPRELEVPGSDQPKVFYQLSDTSQYQNSNILVVGGGDSAAEAALGLGNQPGNRVCLSYRRSEFSRLRDKNRKALHEAAQRGRIRLLMSSEVLEIREKEVALESNGERLLFENDFVFAFLGGTSPNDFLARLGIHVVTKEIPMEGETSDAAVGF